MKKDFGSKMDLKDTKADPGATVARLLQYQATINWKRSKNLILYESYKTSKNTDENENLPYFQNYSLSSYSMDSHHSSLECHRIS